MKRLVKLNGQDETRKFKISWESKLWSNDTERITDLPLDEKYKDKFMNFLYNEISSILNDIDGIIYFTIDNTNFNDNENFILSIIAPEDVIEKLISEFSVFETYVDAYDYSDNLSDFETEDEDEDEGWKLDEVSIGLIIDEI